MGYHLTGYKPFIICRQTPLTAYEVILVDPFPTPRDIILSQVVSVGDIKKDTSTGLQYPECLCKHFLVVVKCLEIPEAVSREQNEIE